MDLVHSPPVYRSWRGECAGGFRCNDTIERLNQSKLQIGATGFVTPNGSTMAVFAGGKHEDGAKNRTDIVDFILWPAGAAPGEAPKWSTARLSAPRSMISVVASSDGAFVFFAGGEYAENRANSSTNAPL